MANIANLDLDIKKGKTVTKVIVTYDICFTRCEIASGSFFSDYADMYGSDPGSDPRLFNIGRKNCFKATKRCIKRKYTKRVSNKLLNEDKGFLGINTGDEVYAKACVKHYVPKGDCANSTIHHDHF